MIKRVRETIVGILRDMWYVGGPPLPDEDKPYVPPKPYRSPQCEEERDDQRVKMVFSDIRQSLEKVGYFIQDDFPGLTEEEKAHMRHIRRHVASLIAQVEKVGKLNT